MDNKLSLGITIAAIFIIIGLSTVFLIVVLEKFVHQEIETHLIDTETILLNIDLKPDDFILLVDITPYLVEIYGQVTMKVPCGTEGEQLLEIIEGDMPQSTTLKMDYIESMSTPDSCVYTGKISENVTFIALKNISNKTISFSDKNNGASSVIVTFHGELSDETDTHGFLRQK